jgi:hypothetical protein
MSYKQHPNPLRIRYIRDANSFVRGPKRWVKPFLDHLRQHGCITHAAEFANIRRDCAYKAAKRHPLFKRAMDACILESNDRIWAEARRRAVDGYNEPVFYKGQLMGIWMDETNNQVEPETPGARYVPLTKKIYSDTLLLALLRARVPGFKVDGDDRVSVDVHLNQEHHEHHEHRITLAEFRSLPLEERVRICREKMAAPPGS